MAILATQGGIAYVKVGLGREMRQNLLEFKSDLESSVLGSHDHFIPGRPPSLASSTNTSVREGPLHLIPNALAEGPTANFD